MMMMMMMMMMMRGSGKGLNCAGCHSVRSVAQMLQSIARRRSRVRVQLSCGKTEFLPYILDGEGKCIVVDNPGSLSESVGLKAADKTPHTLLTHLKKIFKQVETLNR